jgi:hypothetical protein
LGEYIDGAGARRPLPVFNRHAGAKFPGGDKLAALVTNLAGDHKQIAGAHERHVVGRRCGRFSQNDAQLPQLFFYHTGHDRLQMRCKIGNLLGR